MKLTVGDIKIQDFELLEQEIRKSHVDISTVEETWKSLDEYFSKQDEAACSKYFFTYFRLYTDLTWKLFYVLDSEKITQLFSRQLVCAALLEFDVYGKFIEFLEKKSIYQERMETWFVKIGEEIKKSEFKLGEVEGKKYLLKDLFEEVKVVYRPGSSSMDAMDFLGKIKKIINSNGKENISKFFTDNVDQSILQVVKTVRFLQETKPSDLLPVIESYNKELEAQVDAEIRSNSSSRVGPVRNAKQDKTEENKPAQVEKKLPSGSNTVAAPQALVKPPSPPKKNGQEAQTPKKLSYREIRKKIESTFPKDANGNFISITDVLAELQKTAAFQGDPRIKDLFIFNEQKSGFEWNEPMFKE